MLVAVAVVVSLLIGFGAGFWGFKIRTRWCGEHGEILRCPVCVQRRHNAMRERYNLGAF